MKSIIYGASAKGYTVQTIEDGAVIDKYTAGNSPHCSQTYLPHRKGVGFIQVREWAISTANEMADNLGIPRDRVTENSDLVADDLCMADHADMWSISNGEPVRERNTPEWGEMYERWVDFAFADLSPDPFVVS